MKDIKNRKFPVVKKISLTQITYTNPKILSYIHAIKWFASEDNGNYITEGKLLPKPNRQRKT